MGAFLARDVKLGVQATVKLDSFFVDKPPVADPQTVFVTGLTPLDITLAGLDPEEGTLIFKLVSAPSFGELTDSSTPTPVVLDTPGQVIPGVVPQCSDGVDNDNDTSTDFPADPECESANDNDESADPLANPEETGRAAGSSVAATLMAIVTYTADSPGLADPPGDSFSFLVEDVAGNTATAVVTLRSQDDEQLISGSPIANVIIATTIENNDLAITLSGAPAEDPGGNENLTAVTYSIESLPSIGDVADGGTPITTPGTDLSGDQVIYSPDPDTTGSDQFDFKVRLDSNPSNFDVNTVFIEIQETLRFEFTTELSQPLQITLSTTGGTTTPPASELSAAPVAIEGPTGWTNTTNNMTDSRSGHEAVAVTLDDASLTDLALVIGGDSLGETVDVYDVDTNSFTSPLTMQHEHGTGFTATKLSATALSSDHDGKVLVVGGTGARGDAEIWDPATNSFASTGGLNTGRDSHTATLLPDGTVLIAGGITERFIAVGDPEDPADPLNQCNGFVLNSVGLAEIYDPDTGVFTDPGGSVAQFGRRATLLNNGKVLLVGGRLDAPGSGNLSGTKATAAITDCSPLPTSAFGDPPGDADDGNPVTVVPDLVGAALSADGTNLSIDINFTAAFDFTTYGAMVVLDTDQDANTGCDPINVLGGGPGTGFDCLNGTSGCAAI